MSLLILYQQISFRRTADVRSVGYSELFSLSREDVLAAMKDYPEAQEILQALGRKRLMEVKLTLSLSLPIYYAPSSLLKTALTDISFVFIASLRSGRPKINRKLVHIRSFCRLKLVRSIHHIRRATIIIMATIKVWWIKSRVRRRSV